MTEQTSASSMYKRYATFYDHFYCKKDYSKETRFLDQILKKYQVKTVLDVGCGTGTHLSHLSALRYEVEGVDLNLEMVQLAKAKLNGQASQGDMRFFNLEKQYDAVISMFAVFNHNLGLNDAKKTLNQLSKHLNPAGVMILDLYHSQSNGEKEDTYGGFTRIMKWEFDSSTQTCNTVVIFNEKNTSCEERFSLRIYPIAQMDELLKEIGFKKVEYLDNYTLLPGSSSSKNLIVVASR